ncbi:MAG: hypothetical protein JO061_19295, partial [Acidobacteriaceae bacterium]|nr:hypothetical protein [Acidobacteriaceae bacterium]
MSQDLILRQPGAQNSAAHSGGYPAPTHINPYPANVIMNDSRPVDLGEYWATLRRHSKALIAIICLGTALGWAISRFQTPLYQARATFEVQDFNKEFLDAKQVSPISDIDSSLSASEVQTQIKLLESRTLLQRVSDKWKASAPSKRELDPKWMLRHLKVRPIPQTRIIEVLFE